MNWSREQLDIFRWFEARTGTAAVIARAGCGKTTVSVEGAIRSGVPTFIGCFGKDAADELVARIPASSAARASTFHSLGFAALRGMWNVNMARPNSSRARSVAQRVCGDQAPDPITALVARVFDLARQCAPLAEEGKDIAPLVKKFGLDPSAEWADIGYDTAEVCSLAAKAMHEGKRRPATGIDFTDMIWLPVRLGIVRPQFPILVIDEAQDQSPAQNILASMACGGSLALVGDPRQAIFAFRGADTGSMDRIATERGAEEFSLTTTYRCPAAVVDIARRIVPDYRAGDSNPDGILEWAPKTRMMSEVEPGDVILSRVNAPLVTTCLSLIKRGIPAWVCGKGGVVQKIKSTIKYIRQQSRTDSVSGLLRHLELWRAREVKRFAAGRDPETAQPLIEQANEMADTIFSVSEGCLSLRELDARIDRIFSEIKGGRGVELSSIHRAKGREWNRVWVLEDTLRQSSEEELNLAYVAFTRAKEALYLVGEPESGLGRWEKP